MATLAVRAKGIVLCSACGRLDSVKKLAGRGTRNYCFECRNRGRKRDAAADLRARKKQAVTLRTEGKTLQEIARLLKIDSKQVKNYLRKERRK